MVEPGALPPPAERVRPCWPESMLMTDFETETLPLLFACSEDFDSYYDTMQEVHFRRLRVIKQMRQLSVEAREHRSRGELMECVEALDKGCELRELTFIADDYQVVAARQHTVWSAIHLATLQLSQNDTLSAHKLFIAARQRLHSITGEARHIFDAVLQNNAANYWMRRGKPNAAVQHSVRCLSAITKMRLKSPLLEAYAASRVGVAHCVAGNYADALSVLKPLTGQNSTLPDDGHEMPSQKELAELALHTTGVNTCVVELQPADDGQEVVLSKLTVCLTSPATEMNSDWPLLCTLKYVACFSLALANLYTRNYPTSHLLLTRCANLSDVFSEKTLIPANSIWQRRLAIAFELAAEGPNKDYVAKFRMKKDSMVSKERIVTEKIFQSLVVEEKVEAARLKEQSRQRKKAVADALAEGDEEAAEQAKHLVIERDPRLDLSYHRVKTPQQWGKMLPLLQGKHTPSQAVKEFGASITTPSEVARRCVSAIGTERPAKPTIPQRAVTPSSQAAVSLTPESAQPLKRAHSQLERMRKAYESPAPTIPKPTGAKAPKPANPDDILDETFAELADTRESAPAMKQRSMDEAAKAEMYQRCAEILKRKAKKSTKIAEDLTRVEKAFESHETQLKKELLEAKRKQAELEEQLNATPGRQRKMSTTRWGALAKASKKAHGLKKTKSMREMLVGKTSSSLKVDVSANAGNNFMDDFFAHTYNSPQGAQTSHIHTGEDGVMHATKVHDIVPFSPQLKQKQKTLRALLPNLSAGSESYRMVMKELAENERILETQRRNDQRKKLQENALKIAKKAGIVHTLKSMVRESSQLSQMLDDQQKEMDLAQSPRAIKSPNRSFRSPGSSQLSGSPRGSSVASGGAYVAPVSLMEKSVEHDKVAEQAEVLSTTTEGDAIVSTASASEGADKAGERSDEMTPTDEHRADPSDATPVSPNDGEGPTETAPTGDTTDVSVTTPNVSPVRHPQTEVVPETDTSTAAQESPPPVETTQVEGEGQSVEEANHPAGEAVPPVETVDQEPATTPVVEAAKEEDVVGKEVAEAGKESGKEDEVVGKPAEDPPHTDEVSPADAPVSDVSPAATVATDVPEATKMMLLVGANLLFSAPSTSSPTVD